MRIAWWLSSIARMREVLLPKAKVECRRTANQW
jgi:hypothetical protein